MTFISLTMFSYDESLHKKELTLNSDTIVGMYPTPDFTVVDTNGQGYRVFESPKEIVNMIENLKNRKRITGIQSLGNL